MATQFAVDLVFKSTGLNNIQQFQRQLDGLDGAAKKAQGGLGGTAKGLGGVGAASKGASVGVGIFGKALNAALGPIGIALAGVAGLTKAFQTLSQQNFAEAKVRTLGVNSQELTQNLKGLSAELKGQASVVELTSAAYDVASAGFNNAADATKVLRAASLGATGGFTDMNTAGNALTSVLNAYGLSADQATAVMDQFIQTQNDGKIVVAEYAANIGKVAAAAAALDVPLAEVNAAIAQSTAAGVQAEVAFTGVKSALARLASGEAADALKGVGLSIDASTVAADGLIGTLRKMKEAGLDTGQIFKALGTEAAPALLPLLNNLDRTDELLRNQANSAGVAAKAQKEAANTIQGAWKEVTTAFENLFADQSELGQVVIVVLKAVAYNLNQIATGLSILLAPFKQVLGVVMALWDGAVQLKDAFFEVFAQSEFAQALSLIFERIQSVVMKIAEVAAPLLKKGFNDVLYVVKQVAGWIADRLFYALDKVIQGVVAVGKHLPIISGLAKKIEAEWNGIKNEIAEAKNETAKTAEEAQRVANSSSEAAAAAKELKKAQEAVTKEIQETVKALDEQAQIQTTVLDQSLSLTQARLQAEQAVNQVLLEQAQRQLDGAKTQADRVKAAQDVYNLTVRQAELEYQATSAAIEAEARKSDIALQNAQLKAKEVEAVVRLAQAQGVVTDAHWKALEAQYQAVQLAERAQEVAWKVAAAQEAAAQATYEGKVNAAKAAYEQNIVAKNTQAAATAAGGFASNMERAAQAAKETAAAVQKAATAIGTTSTGTGAVTTELNGDIPPELQAQIKKAQQEIWDRAANSGSAMAILEAFNKGQAVAVEMVNEYQKNAGKLEQFNGTMDLLDKAAQAFSKGMGDAGRYFENLARQGLSRQDWEVAQREYANRPGAANLGGAISHYSQPVATPRSVDPQVNITTGPVTQVDGTNFVTQADLMSATQSAAKQGAAMAISNLARDPAARRMAGLVR